VKEQNSNFSTVEIETLGISYVAHAQIVP
jgi:hypothetical protein